MGMVLIECFFSFRISTSLFTTPSASIWTLLMPTVISSNFSEGNNLESGERKWQYGTRE